MEEVFFNTNEVANMLRVDKSTVKRWTDEGKLKCFRTPGGHRKFRADDVYNFMLQYNYNVSGLTLLPQLASDETILKRIVQKEDFHALISVCFSAAIRGNKEEVLALLLEIHRAGLAVSLIFDHLLRPTMKRIAVIFNANKISFSEHRLALNTLSAAAAQLGNNVARLPRNNKIIITVSLEQEESDLELTALITLLEIEGFTVLNLGSGLTADAVNQLVDKVKPFAVCIHTTFAYNEDRFVFEVESVLRASKENMTQLVLSGNALQNRSIEENFVGITLCKTFSDFSVALSPETVLTKTREIED